LVDSAGSENKELLR